jgi:hypothetical protein
MEHTDTDMYRAFDDRLVWNQVTGVAPTYLSADMVLEMAAADTDAFWRIEEFADGQVRSMYIGFAPIDSKRVIDYNSSSDLPEWVKDRVAVLRMLPCDPTNSVVFGVGRRISEHVFWVVE